MKNRRVVLVIPMDSIISEGLMVGATYTEVLGDATVDILLTGIHSISFDGDNCFADVDISLNKKDLFVVAVNAVPMD